MTTSLALLVLMTRVRGLLILFLITIRLGTIILVLVLKLFEGQLVVGLRNLCHITIFELLMCCFSVNTTIDIVLPTPEHLMLIKRNFQHNPL